MQRWIKSHSKWLLGDARHFPLEHRMLNVTNLLGSIIFFSASLMNATMGLGLGLTILCAVVGAVAVVLYVKGRRAKDYTPWVPWTVLNIYVSCMLGFFFNGGSHGGIQYYIVVGIMVSMVLVKPSWRVPVTLAFLLGISLALVLEFRYPHWINGYPNAAERHTDVLISMVSSGAIIALCMSVLFDNFRLFKGLLVAEKHRSISLVRNTMPRRIANRLLQGENRISESHGNVTVLFADIMGFTSAVAHEDPQKVVLILDELFQRFDVLVHQLGLEKVKTIGDAYMAVAGMPDTRTDHADACCELGQKMIQVAREMNLAQKPIELRIGIASGPVIAGVIGNLRKHYDLWGNTVNVASRLQSLGTPGTLHLSDSAQKNLIKTWLTESRGLLVVKGLEPMETWEIMG